MTSANKTNLSGNVAVCIEEAEWVVCTAVDCNADICDVVIGIWSRLCSPKRTFVVGVANIELIVVRGVRLQILRFDLRYC